MDTLGPAKSVQGVLIFLHDNVSFGTTVKCVDYAGVHIFKYPVLFYIHICTVYYLQLFVNLQI